jgi:hypothetical protein
MLTLLGFPPTGYEPEKAEALAKLLNESEDACGWTYRVKYGPEGSPFALVEALDEEGEHVGYF